ncbi:MAG TPA: ATP-binding cassette domain-containing protein [Chloroflexota bacterium]|nr:ATP-binding cassette domain-containing protein [Chloroflexota bacterium]
MTTTQPDQVGAPHAERPPALQLRDITKRFGPVLADDHVNLTALPGEVHALVGENGAGKTTLMNIVFGLVQPDSGEILVNGKPVTINNPMTAREQGIGMVHQHFKLVPSISVAENVFLGQEPIHRLGLDVGEAVKRVQQLAKQFNLEINPRARVSELSVGLRQRVEILKAISYNPQILILDEPTAVLTPQETTELFRFIRTFVAEGRTVIFITHKLGEVKEVTDRFTVIRDGRNVATLPTAESTEADIARLMVGREVLLRVDKTPAHPGAATLQLEQVSATDNQGLRAVNDVSFAVRSGEIVGIAGVEGNGQTELVEVIAGLRPVVAGQLYLTGDDITRASVGERRVAGIAHIPEDRLDRGVAGPMSIQNNLDSAYLKRGLAPQGILRPGLMLRWARHLIRRYDIRGARPASPVGSLSGGNMQKVVLAREMELHPRLLIAAQPTRGVDIGATEFVHNALLAQRDAGAAILLISADLNEIRTLSDRILVMYRGRIMGEYSPAASDSELGLAMAGVTGEGEHAEEPPVPDDASQAARAMPSVDIDHELENGEGEKPLSGESVGTGAVARALGAAVSQPAVAIIGALLLGILVILATGDNPLQAYQYFLAGPLSTSVDIGNTLATLSPLLLAALSVLVSFRAGIFNIGAEGQLYLGAFAAAWVGFTFTHWPGPLIIVVSIALSMVAGALWALIPGALLAAWGVDIIVSTLMLNYIAMEITDYLVNNPFKNPTAGSPVSNLVATQSWLPVIIPGSTLTTDIFVAIAVTLIVAFILYRTSWGLKLRFVGDNPHFASYLGISVPRMIVQTMLVSGAIAGIVGALDVYAVDHQFNQQFSPGYGFLGLTVVLLGRLNPWGAVVAGFIYAILIHGADVMQLNTNVPYPLVNILQGIIVLFMTATGLTAWFVKRRRRTIPEGLATTASGGQT